VGGRVDTPPTIHRGLCIFGCHDGWVYALRAKDGQLAWRTQVAPWERRMVAFGQVESVWPVIGSVVIHENVLYATAGRTTESDGGLAVVALDPATGRQAWAKAIAPGPSRVNDLLILRDDKLAMQNVTVDPKTGASAASPKGPKLARDTGLDGLIDASWTRLGTRRSGGALYGATVAEIIVWNDAKTFAYDSHSRTVTAIPTEVAKTTSRPSAKEQAWRLPMPADHQAEAMALCDGALVLAGRAWDAKQEKLTGFLWVVSPEDGKKIAELPLEAPPVYQGLAVAGQRVYVSLQNGATVCFGQKG
jgi:hypothetical protein